MYNSKTGYPCLPWVPEPYKKFVGFEPKFSLLKQNLYPLEQIVVF